MNGQRMVLMLGKTKKEVKLPDLRGEDEKNPSKPLQIICKKEGAKIIYERRIDVFDSYEELIKGATSAVSVALKQKAIEGAFIKEGKEAVVAFENGQVQQLDLLDGDEFTRWTSEKPDDETRFSRASVGDSGSFVHVIFPETGRYVLLYTDCNGKEVAYEDQAKGGVSIRCTGAVCVTKDEKNRVVETLKVPCPPKTEKK